MREEHLGVTRNQFTAIVPELSQVLYFFSSSTCAHSDLCRMGNFEVWFFAKEFMICFEMHGPNASIFIDPIEKRSPFCPRVGRYDHCASKVGLPLGFVMESHGLRDNSTTAQRTGRKLSTSLTRKKVIWLSLKLKKNSSKNAAQTSYPPSSNDDTFHTQGETSRKHGQG